MNPANSTPVRVRFAPSPTGPLHIGGVRTALYNYLFARHTGGQFILRIEDTDQSRFVPQSETYLRQTLAWLRLTPDESPWQGGNYGPYRQSERQKSYLPYALQLVAQGDAYYAFDTSEELEAMRQQQKALGAPAPKYNAITRMALSNSLTSSADEVKRKIAAGMPYVIRMKVNPKELIKFKDQVRGWIQVEGRTLDDKVLFKSDGMPTYHLANVIDDHLMKITHVIRGEEWLPSTPLHVLLYKALHWTPPHFVHLPLLLRADGQGKLSKRATDKDTLTLPMDWQDPTTKAISPGFQQAGYLPQAVLNFLALLGWHPGGNKEFFTLDELRAAFSLERLKRAGIRFDMYKANWLNGQHLRALPPEIAIDRYLRPHLDDAHLDIEDPYLHKVYHLIKERTTFPQELWPAAKPFFMPPSPYQTLPETHAPLFAAWHKKLRPLTTWHRAPLQELLKKEIQQHKATPSQVLPALRTALLGTKEGPHIAEVMEVLGKKETLARLDRLKFSPAPPEPLP